MIGHHDGLADAGFGCRWSSEDVEVFADPLGIGEQAAHIDAVAMLCLEVLDSPDEISGGATCRTDVLRRDGHGELPPLSRTIESQSGRRRRATPALMPN